MNTVQALAVAAASLALGLFAGGPDQRLAPVAIGAVTELSYALPDLAQGNAQPLRLALAGAQRDGGFEGALYKELRWAALKSPMSAPAYALRDAAVSPCEARKSAAPDNAATIDRTASLDPLAAASGQSHSALPDHHIHLHARL